MSHILTYGKSGKAIEGKLTVVHQQCLEDVDSQHRATSTHHQAQTNRHSPARNIVGKYIITSLNITPKNIRCDLQSV